MPASAGRDMQEHIEFFIGTYKDGRGQPFGGSFARE